MIARLKDWLSHKWRTIEQRELLEAYGSTFGSLHGQLVLQDLLDRVYCQTYEGTDPQGAVIQNAKRQVVHDILYNIELATSQRVVHTITEDEHGREQRTDDERDYTTAG